MQIGIWQNNKLPLNTIKYATALQNMLLDFKLKLIVARTIREGEQSII